MTDTTTTPTDKQVNTPARPVCRECGDEIAGRVHAVYLEHEDGSREELPVCRGCFHREHFLN